MTSRAATLVRLKHWGPVWLGGVCAVVVIGGLAILPARTWMTQRSATAHAEAELQQVDGRVAELEAQLTLLETDDEIERMARENFDLVKPGEESYRLLPAPEAD